MLSAEGLLQIRHLNRCQCGFQSLVAHLQASAIDRLLQRVTCEYPECVRHASFLRRLADPTRHFVDDDVVMRGISAQQAAEADDRVVLLRFCERAGRRGNLESARDANDVDVLVLRTGTDESVVRAAQQAVGDELVESGNHYDKTQALRVQSARNRLHVQLRFNRIFENLFFVQ